MKCKHEFEPLETKEHFWLDKEFNEKDKITNYKEGTVKITKVYCKKCLSIIDIAK
jgi:hypothetical protein